MKTHRYGNASSGIEKQGSSQVQYLWPSFNSDDALGRAARNLQPRTTRSQINARS